MCALWNPKFGCRMQNLTEPETCRHREPNLSGVGNIEAPNIVIKHTQWLLQFVKTNVCKHSMFTKQREKTIPFERLCINGTSSITLVSAVKQINCCKFVWPEKSFRFKGFLFEGVQGRWRIGKMSSDEISAACRVPVWSLGSESKLSKCLNVSFHWKISKSFLVGFPN